jgi:hypothetical protein
MKIAELIALATSRLARLNMQRGEAASVGDVALLLVLDPQIAETEATLARLRSLTE